MTRALGPALTWPQKNTRWLNDCLAKWTCCRESKRGLSISGNIYPRAICWVGYSRSVSTSFGYRDEYRQTSRVKVIPKLVKGTRGLVEVQGSVKGTSCLAVVVEVSSDLSSTGN